MKAEKAEETRKLEATAPREIPFAIRRLLDEVRTEDAMPNAYNRMHNRHNRS
jgi:hypothetical protein